MAAEKNDVSLPVDKLWLQKLIQTEYGTSAEIKSLTCEAIGEKKGFVSTVIKVDIEYSDEDNSSAAAKQLQDQDKKSQPPKNLIIKIPCPDKLAKATEQIPELSKFFDKHMVQRVHNTEVTVYEHFQRENSKAPIPMAKCLWAEKMENNAGGLIIMEFVRGESITFNENYTVEQLDTLVEHVAALHAYSIKTGFADQLGPLDYSFYGTTENNLVRDSLEKIRDHFPDILGGVTEAQIDRTVERVDQLRYKLCRPDQLGYPPVVVFGDTQPNNILFRTGDPNPEKSGRDDSKIEVAAFIDFQFMHAGSRVYDLCALAFWGAPTGIKHETTVQQMLKHYHDCLRSMLEVEKMPLTFTLEELKREFHEFYPILISIYLSWFRNPEMARTNAGVTDERMREMIQRIMVIL